jgi:hypothetical protein
MQGSEELFYQLGLRQFGALSHIRLEPAPALRTLLALAIDAEDTSSSALSKSELVDVRATASVPRHGVAEADVTGRRERTPRPAGVARGVLHADHA